MDIPALPVNGKCGKFANPSGAVPHLPLHRGGFWEAAFKFIPYSPAPAGEKAVPEGWPHNGSRAKPWSASTASKRWRFFRRFLAAKSDSPPAGCRYARQQRGQPPPPPLRGTSPYTGEAWGFSPGHWPLFAADLFRNQHFVLVFASCCARFRSIAAQAKKSPHRAGAGRKQRSVFTSSFPRPDGRAGPRRPAYTGCPGHGRTCRSRGGSCRGLPPTADGRGRDGCTR